MMSVMTKKRDRLESNKSDRRVCTRRRNEDQSHYQWKQNGQEEDQDKHPGDGHPDPKKNKKQLRRQSHFPVEGMAMPKRTPDRVVPNGCTVAGAAPESPEVPADVEGEATAGDNGASNRRTCRAP